jgi:phosphopantothenoylcysteine synthetase/decarboxylase
MKILITSGGTRVPIDTVRHIGNMSSGTFGAKIALEALVEGHEIIFLHAKGSKHPLIPYFNSVPNLEDLTFTHCEYVEYIDLYLNKCKTVAYENFYSYKNEVEKLIKEEKPDVIVLAAAVSEDLISAMFQPSATRIPDVRQFERMHTGAVLTSTPCQNAG